MNLEHFDLPAEAEQKVERIEQQMIENDRENERLRREMEQIIGEYA